MKKILVFSIFLCDFLVIAVNNEIKITSGFLCANEMLCDDSVEEGQEFHFFINIVTKNLSADSDENYELTAVPQNKKICELSPINLNISSRELIGSNFSFHGRGLLIGKTKLVVTLKNSSVTFEEKLFELRVVQSQSSLQFYFTLFIGFFISLNNVNMGCTLDLEVIKKVLKKPIAPAIGFVSQFMFMPIVSMQIGKYLFADHPAWRLGLFVFGCCPGGALSNFWTLLFEGDIDLSVTMTFISDCAALGMMPFWLFVFGKEITKNSDLKIPFVNMIVSLIILTASLGLGLIIQRYKPKLAAKMTPFVRPLAIILIVIVVFGGIYVNSFIFRVFEWSVLLAGLMVAWGGYIFGAIMAAIARLPCHQIIAVSIETAFQNPGVAYVLLQTSLPQPDADLAALPIVGQLLATGPPLWVIITVVYFVKRWYRKKKQNEIDSEKGEDKNNEQTEKFIGGNK